VSYLSVTVVKDAADQRAATLASWTMVAHSVRLLFDVIRRGDVRSGRRSAHTVPVMLVVMLMANMVLPRPGGPIKANERAWSTKLGSR
jgi:hypothetical protein